MREGLNPSLDHEGDIYYEGGDEETVEEGDEDEKGGSEGEKYDSEGDNSPEAPVRAPSKTDVHPSKRPGSKTHRRTRVGFLSKFLGLFEPHGLLLDGVMAHLPRDEFEVWALAVARTDGKPLAWGVQVSGI